MSRRIRHSQQDNEVNLMPVISVLAVCISFLLLTAVWVNVGSFELNQALGTETVDKATDEAPKLWIEFQNSGSVKFEVRVGSRITARTSSSNAVRDIDQIARNYRRQNPDLKTALVIPAPKSRYQDLIKVMDGLKKNEISEIGIAPL